MALADTCIILSFWMSYTHLKLDIADNVNDQVLYKHMNLQDPVVWLHRVHFQLQKMPSQGY